MKQKMTLLFFFALVIILAIIPIFHTKEPPAQAVEPVKEPSSKISRLLFNEPVLVGALAGISIRSADDGTLLYEHNADTRMQPASVMKLFTSAAALSVLGEEYRFTTEVLADGKITGGTLVGDLFLKGMGDPTLLPSDFDEMAMRLKSKGIKKVTGDIVADDSWYDDVRYSEDLTWNDEHQYYGAQVSALTASPNKDFDAGTVIVEVLPGKAGKAAAISVEPNTDFVTIINEAVTVDSTEKEDIQIEREHGTNTIKITGSIPADLKKVRKWVGIWEPSLYAGSIFKKSLEEQGIKVVGKIKTGHAADTMTGMISHKSMPLAELLIPFMKLSNNGHAEVLVKEMGKAVHGEGSWEKGLEVMDVSLSEIGIDTSQLVLRDGSGISHVNLIPANEVSKLLYLAQKEEWFPVFQRALPVAGAKDRLEGGTLRYRLQAEAKSAKIQAKTGTLTGVSTLAGYVKSDNGDTFIFTIMLNNLLDDREGRKVEDRIVRMLAG